MQADRMQSPRLIVAALRGGSGKTILSLGIIAALRQKGYRVAPFKKGPDYIDAGWLALAAGRPCYNLDSYLLSADCILNSFQSHFQPGDISVIEGNRGLYDDIDLEGSTSTAELASPAAPHFSSVRLLSLVISLSFRPRPRVRRGQARHPLRWRSCPDTTALSVNAR